MFFKSPIDGAMPRSVPLATQGRPVESSVRKLGGQTSTITYRQMSDLPAGAELVSQDGGKYVLPPKSRECMCILKLRDIPDSYSVLAIKDAYGSADYADAVNRIRSNGDHLHLSGISDGPLINALYATRNGESQSLNEDDIKPIAKDLDDLIQAALDMNASDVHIEIRTSHVRVAMRVNGRITTFSDTWRMSYAMTMARAMHTLADEDSKDTTFSSDGQMSISRDLPSGSRVKLRVQMSNAYPDGGIDIVTRVLKVAASANVKTMKALGYALTHIEMLEYMLSSPRGLIIVAGITGSGKSTTLQTSMMDIRKKDSGLKMISIEDPPEYILEGVTQIPVARRRSASKDENPFAFAMRATMRMDPDVIMVGEIRDTETANLMVSMVQSGHKVLSTIHTESGLGVFGRLRSMGVGLDVLGSRSFISGLIYQTLVPVLCMNCREEYTPAIERISPALHERIKHVTKPTDTLFLEARNTVEHPNTCTHCNGKGIVGRTVCAEMVIPNQKILECVLKGEMNQAYEHWRSLRKRGKDSMIGSTALDHGITKMCEGVVSPVDVEGALGLLFDFSQESGIIGVTGNELGLEFGT